MLNKVKRTNLFATGRKAALIFLTAASLVFQTSCKDDDNKIDPGGTAADPTATIPAKGKKYSYKVTEEDGSVSTEVIRVKSTSDSAGLSVFHIETLIKKGSDQAVMDWKSYSKNGFTINEVPLPASLSGLISELESAGTVKDFRITGFPQYQERENKAAVGSKLTFKGGDIKVYVKLDVVGEDGKKVVVEVQSTLSYEDGQVVKIENITTPAGTFSCSKWAYGYTNITRVFYNGEEGEQINEEYNVTDWTAAGIGIVKSVEGVLFEESVTELQDRLITDQVIEMKKLLIYIAVLCLFELVTWLSCT